MTKAKQHKNHLPIITEIADNLDGCFRKIVDKSGITYFDWRSNNVVGRCLEGETVAKLGEARRLARDSGLDIIEWLTAMDIDILLEGRPASGDDSR